MYDIKINWFIVSPSIQFASTGFFGTTDNTNVINGTTFVNGTLTSYSIIGYDSSDSSLAGPADTFSLDAGTVITLNVKACLHFIAVWT